MTGHRKRTDSLAKDLGSLVTDFAVSQVSWRPMYEQEQQLGVLVRVFVSYSILP